MSFKPGFDAPSYLLGKKDGGGGGGGEVLVPKDNLVCNWDFTKPINNRGLTSYISKSNTSMWAIDGWRVANYCGIEIVTGGIKLVRGSYDGYFIQNARSNLTVAIAEKDLCASAIVNGVLYSATDKAGSASGLGHKFGVTLGGVSFRLWVQSDYVEVTIDINSGSKDSIISAIKLEAGTTSSLYVNNKQTHQDDPTEVIKMPIYLYNI